MVFELLDNSGNAFLIKQWSADLLQRQRIPATGSAMGPSLARRSAARVAEGRLHAWQISQASVTQDLSGLAAKHTNSWEENVQ